LRLRILHVLTLKNHDFENISKKLKLASTNWNFDSQLWRICRE